MRPPCFAAIAFLLAPLAAQTATYATFTSLNPTPAAPSRERAILTHDEARHRTLLGGGYINGNVRQETWEFDGAAWTQVVAPHQLNFSKPVRFVYSPQLARVVAVTGDSVNGGSSMVVHGWTGSDWTVLAASGPASRSDDYEIAWDASRGVLVMFGGGQTGAETWEWNGTAWAQRGAGGPPARNGHRMVYDEARGVVVLQGGYALQGGGAFTDTWEWNGAYWLQRFGIAPPPAGLRVIVYQRTRQRVVVHGGYDNLGNQVGGVYEYDGNGWVSVPTVGGPTLVAFTAGAYDPVADEIVLFGGVYGGTLQGTRVIRYVTGTVASSYPHHVGCPGPTGVATIGPINGGRPVLGSMFRVRFAGLPASPLSLVVGAFGTSDQSWGGVPLPLDLTPFGFTSCSLFVEPTILELLSNGGGFADWTLLLPNDPMLDGVQFFVQGMVLVPGFNPAGAVLTSSLRGVAGIL